MGISRIGSIKVLVFLACAIASTWTSLLWCLLYHSPWPVTNRRAQSITKLAKSGSPKLAQRKPPKPSPHHNHRHPRAPSITARRRPHDHGLKASNRTSGPPSQSLNRAPHPLNRQMASTRTAWSPASHARLRIGEGCVGELGVPLGEDVL